jgi:cysteinyl-tRNA synthetase
VEPKVTEHIPQIITFVKELVENKKAYVIDSDVYFDISSFKDYGKLSGRSLDDMLAGARVETDLRKKNPGDFALWKGNTQNLYWISPWGYGRPGWHIECSVMAKCYLGTTIDIHGGGMDLIFPHHENEVAQSEALHGVCFSHYWLHNAFLTINKEKMSKSLGNFVTLRDIFTQFDPMVLRYFILQHHYRTPIDFGIEELKASQVAYKKLINVFGAVDSTTVTHRKVLDASVDNKAVLEMVLALCDDLNSPKLIGLVFENLDKAKNDVILAEIIKFLLSNVMGLTLQPLKEVGSEFTPEIEALINKREQARKDKNWALADKVRDELVKLGYKPQDKKI